MEAGSGAGQGEGVSSAGLHEAAPSGGFRHSLATLLSPAHQADVELQGTWREPLQTLSICGFYGRDWYGSSAPAYDLVSSQASLWR